MTRKKRVGRPLAQPDANGRCIISVQAGARLKQALIAAADQNDRSLSQEIIVRLERSFLMDEVAAFLRGELSGLDIERAPDRRGFSLSECEAAEFQSMLNRAFADGEQTLREAKKALLIAVRQIYAGQKQYC